MGNRQTRGASKQRATTTRHNSHGNDANLKSSATASKVHHHQHQQQQQQQQEDATRAPDVVDAGRQLQVNIYRSYSQLGNGPASRGGGGDKPPTTEYRVYRRSARPQLTAANRSMSLPRSFGRTQRLADQLDVSTMPRSTAGATRPIARSSSRASNISSTPSASRKGLHPSLFNICRYTYLLNLNVTITFVMFIDKMTESTNCICPGYPCVLGDIQLDESGFGFCESIRDVRV